MATQADKRAPTSKEDCTKSNHQTKPPENVSLTLDFNNGQFASFVSQGSSSPKSFANSSYRCEEDAAKPEDSENISFSQTEDSALESDSSRLKAHNGISSQSFLAGESVPSSIAFPDLHSTPVKEEEYLSTVSEEGGSVMEAEALEDEKREPELIMPGDLVVPIIGYETMEARSRFTVYKINVQRTVFGEECSSWFVFRRYSDFVHLNERLKHMFPDFRLSLPPKRWFRDNFDQDFLEERVQGLQLFLDNVIGHKNICNSAPVRGFLCTDDPPGPHDSLEESRALCDTLEETVYGLRQELQEKDAEMSLLKEELDLYKSQVELLSGQLRFLNKKHDHVLSSSARQSFSDSDLESLTSPPVSGSQTPIHGMRQEEQTSTPGKQ